MALHKRILEWQAAHPTITWLFWLIVWIVVLVLLFKPSSTGGMTQAAFLVSAPTRCGVAR